MKMSQWADLLDSWTAELTTETALAERTIRAYLADAEAFARWAEAQGIEGPEQVTTADVRGWRDSGAAGKAPATINRRLISVAKLLDFAGRTGRANPARRVPRLADVAPSDEGRALTLNEWRAVRRAAEAAGQLETALVCLLRYAGPRVGEIAPETARDPCPLLLGDITIGPRSGELLIRRGKGGKRRRIPLVLEARDALSAYLEGDRRQRLDAWVIRGRLPVARREWWDGPSAPVFLGERGPLTVRGVRHIVERLGRDARLPYVLGPHDLRATFISALVDPSKYGLRKEPMPLHVAARLAGHSSVDTTARYAAPSLDDLARWMDD
ncbi:tyrosine-type recombinase/integrase [Symbiobacterium thermophilum]|uniref:Integrase n=1 Tax=Symbiobacterium thermophilum TaxID=2734 RepID=A0A953LKC6_SYMTR|nr:tyrosine-type recombinase/integrase [Symbiobacterium thermophilum]MBY6276832.1 hypothetical protein [Symbiobacterium thermophilum]